ncbi:hypothetical protein E4U53_002726 [Claviceps sorghi]|nr:hypothetical protein E4U53_002726 [Claviceps sorghi]
MGRPGEALSLSRNDSLTRLAVTVTQDYFGTGLILASMARKSVETSHVSSYRTITNLDYGRRRAPRGTLSRLISLRYR